MNLFSRLLRKFRSIARQINIKSGNYIEQIFGNYIQNIYNIVYKIKIVYIGTREERSTLLQRDKKQQDLLDYVQHEIASRLKQSLHKRVSILIDKEEDPSQVNPPWAIEVKIGSRQPFSLPPKTKIIDIYDRKEIKGKLLILGEPGSGKTTTLLQLAEVLANRASKDINQPIPVLLNLSSWQDDKQSIKDWIISNIKVPNHKVNKNISQTWLESANIILLLDGLDELDLDRQEKCVKQINNFLNSEGWLHSLVVCSRTEEYQHYRTQLALSGSIILQPLSEEQIQDFVLRTEGEQLWLNIKDDSNLMDLAKTPLLLNIIVISCEEISFDNWQSFKTKEKRFDYIFEAYIRRMLSRPSNKKYKNIQSQKIINWLQYLACKILVTDFSVKEISNSTRMLEKRNEEVIHRTLVYFGESFIASIMLGLVYEFTDGFGTLIRLNDIFLGALIAWIFISFFEVSINLADDYKTEGIIGILICYLILIFLSYFFMEFFEIIFSFILVLQCIPLIDVLSVWIFKDRGLFCEKFILRLILYWKGYLPWNYNHLFDYCTDRLFLQRVGGGYRFIHRLLKQHFAKKWRAKERVQRRKLY